MHFILLGSPLPSTAITKMKLGISSSLSDDYFSLSYQAIKAGDTRNAWHLLKLQVASHQVMRWLVT